jgi:hypothetical protein
MTNPPAIYTSVIKKCVKKYRDAGYTDSEILNIILRSCDMFEEAEEEVKL